MAGEAIDADAIARITHDLENKGLNALDPVAPCGRSVLEHRQLLEAAARRPRTRRAAPAHRH